MYAKRIIPCLDVKNGRVVKGMSFVNLVDAGDPVESAKQYDKQGADELVFLDITASSDARNKITFAISSGFDSSTLSSSFSGSFTAGDAGCKRRLLRRWFSLRWLRTSFRGCSCGHAGYHHLRLPFGDLAFHSLREKSR